MNSGCSGIRGEPEKPSNISVELVLFAPPLAKSSVKWKKKKKVMLCSYIKLEENNKLSTGDAFSSEWQSGESPNPNFV